MFSPIINGGEDRVWIWSKMVEFPTFMGSWPWPWIRAWSLPFFISHRVLPVYQISSRNFFRRNFLWTDGRMDGWTDGNLPPIVLGRLPKFGSRPKNRHHYQLFTFFSLASSPASLEVTKPDSIFIFSDFNSLTSWLRACIMSTIIKLNKLKSNITTTTANKKNCTN